MKNSFLKRVLLTTTTLSLMAIEHMVSSRIMPTRAGESCSVCTPFPLVFSSSRLPPPLAPCRSPSTFSPRSAPYILHTFCLVFSSSRLPRHWRHIVLRPPPHLVRLHIFFEISTLHVQVVVSGTHAPTHTTTNAHTHSQTHLVRKLDLHLYEETGRG